MKTNSAARQLDEFIAKFSPEIAELTHASLKRLRLLLPGAIEMVYDNYNALVIGFCPAEKASEVIVSLAVYPRWANLCFFAGDSLPDPQNLLRGGGKVVRTIRLDKAAMLDRPAVKALVKAAIEDADTPPDRKQAGRIVIACVSQKQRPRRVKQKPGTSG